MKPAFSFVTPIKYPLIGSFFLHVILVLVYGNLLTAKEVSPPPPPKKFKIEMVTKKPLPFQKVQKKENKITTPKKLAPVAMKRPLTSVSTKKIINKKIAIQPASHSVPKHPNEDIQKINPSKKLYQQARVSMLNDWSKPNPRTLESLKVHPRQAQNVQSSQMRKAKPADFSPLPRPVENNRFFPRIAGKEAGFRKSPAGFAPSLPKPKSVSPSTLLPNEGKATARVHNDRKIIPANLPSPGRVAVTHPQDADLTRTVELKRGVPSRALFSTPAQIRSVSAKTITGGNPRAGIVQKGERMAMAAFPAPRPVPDIVDPKVLQGYLSTLQRLIASAKKYPESARQSGQEGKVTVQFTVMKNGNVKNIKLLSKTNYPDLDDEAIKAVKRAAPFSNLPREIDKPFLKIVLPFKFQLNDKPIVR